MVVLVLSIQIVSLVFYFKFLDEGGDYEGSSNGKYTFEGCLWYIIAGLNFLFILRSIYVLIMYSYRWLDYILEFISLGISLFATILTSIYLLIKRYRKNKRSNSK